ncbi:MAG: type III PLP-dependent enzyme [Candidatus Pacebacteria bacterium]|nr:type III PLP-dependent enzyme [Candidatus Paceibacterota bacterium]
MSLEIERFINKKDFNFVRSFAQKKETPFLLINLAKVSKNYDRLKKSISYAKIYYAVKANPNDEILKTLIKKGSCFDIATVFELDKVLSLGALSENISYGNTIKKERDIAYAYKKGVRLFATDSISDLEKISKKARKSKVFFRIMCDGDGADWPLSKKFGAHPDTIFNLALEAKSMGLIPYGISFHVGSQQRDIAQWDNAIAQCKYLFDSLRERGVELKMINIGGGFPSDYLKPTKSLNVYSKEITRFLKEDFGAKLPEIIVEPGRSMVGDCGIIVSEVIMISEKSATSNYKWMYLDVGKFGGLIETIDEAIKYPIFSEQKSRKLQEYIIAGPTCDSYDVLYEKNRYKLNSNIKEGDRLYIFTTGAYTASYSSVCFNGIPPLRTFCVKRFKS